MKPVTVGPFLGMNNRLPAEKLHVPREGDFVSSAVNGDFTAAGTFRRRKGFAPVVVGTSTHSLVGFDDIGFVVEENHLCSLHKEEDGTIVRNAIYTVTQNLQFSYTRAPLAIYASNGREFLRIDRDSVLPVGLPSPDEPRVSAIGGGLPPGVYQVAVSYRDASGRDSGVSLTARIELPIGGGISIDYAAERPAADTILYMTAPNGDQLFETNLPGYSGQVITALPAEGARPVAMMTAPLPAGQIVRYHRGKLYSAAGALLFFSEPYGLELCDLAENCIPFPEPITLVEPCVNGLYISADKTYWLSTDDMKLTPVLPYKAVGGTGNVRRDSEEVWWMSTRGLVRGDQTGTVENMQEERVAVSPAMYGASLMREEDGEKQFVATSFDPRQTVTAARAWIDAEVIRKETQL